MRVLKYRRTAGRRPGLRHVANRARVHVHVVVGDSVRVMRGDDKGKEGKIMRVYPKTGRVTVEGVNIVKRHRKARRPEEQSGIMEHPAPIHASNVMLLDPQSGLRRASVFAWMTTAPRSDSRSRVASRYPSRCGNKRRAAGGSRPRK